MNTFFFKKIFVLTFLLLMLGEQSAFAKKMYRWVDGLGNIRYSDQVPPDQVTHRRESLNQNARVIKVLDKEKTKAQRELEERLVILRRQQQGIIAKQKAHDKVLLSTFRNIDDMKLALNGKMLALDGQRNVLQSNLNGLEHQLQQQQKKAAQHERDGNRIPKKLLDKITNSKQQLTQTKAEIIRHIDKKERIKKAFEADLDRFSFLTQSNMESKELSLKTAESKAANELGLYICESDQRCEKAWANAKLFVTLHSTTEIEIETDKLIMSRSPYKDTDLSLSVSKMDMVKKKKQIFLDIRCRRSSLGKELCSGPEAEKIRSTFSGYIKSALAEEN